MALTTLIQYDDEFKCFFKRVIPQKSAFKTMSGHKAFSDEYIEQAVYNLSNSYSSGLVGTAFDYLARWTVARVAKQGCEISYTGLVAELGVPRCGIEADRKGVDVKDKYEKGIECCRRFVEGTLKVDDIVETSIFFAKLEQIYRRQLSPFQVDIEDLFRIDKEVIDDLLTLAKVFEKEFIESGIVTRDSIVVYNPAFGGASAICGGADADIYIDGTLYDFKCTRKHGYVWNEVAQILGYYLLDSVAKINMDQDNELHGFEIKRIAFYRARYGEIEFVDMDREDNETMVDEFVEILGRDAYAEYFEARKKEEEEERERQEHDKRIEDKYNKLLTYLGKHSWYEECLQRYTTQEEQLRWMTIVVNSESNARIPDKIDGSKVQNLMVKQNISIQALAERVGVTPVTIKNWMSGKSNPLAGALIDMTEVLHCDIKEVVKGKDEMVKKVKLAKKRKR